LLQEDRPKSWSCRFSSWSQRISLRHQRRLRKLVSRNWITGESTTGLNVRLRTGHAEEPRQTKDWQSRTMAKRILRKMINIDGAG